MAREIINGISVPVAGTGEPADFIANLRLFAIQLGEALELLLDTDVPPRVIEALAADDTPAQAAAAAVTDELAERNLTELSAFVEEDDARFTIAGEDRRRTWLEVNAAGGPTIYAAAKILAAIDEALRPVIDEQTGLADFESEVNDGVMFVVTDQDRRRTELEVGADGKLTERVIASIGARLNIEPTVRTGEPDYSPRVAPYDARLAFYGNPQTGARRWLNKVAAAIEGESTAHLAIYGTSRVYGAEGAGSNYPKWSNAFPGLVRDYLDELVGESGGTGQVMPWDEVFAYPAGDPRWTFGAGVTHPTTYGGGGGTGPGYGAHGIASAVIGTGALGYVEFTPTVPVDRFRFAIVRPAGSTGLATVKVDGSSVGTISVAPNNAGSPSLSPEAGHASAIAVYNVTGLPSGLHTLRIDGVTSSECILTMVEGGTGKGIAVSSFARSSSSYTEWNRDEATGLYGMAHSIDLAAPDLAIVGDFTNNRGDLPITLEGRVRVHTERLLGAGSEVLYWAPSSPNFTALGNDPVVYEPRWLDHIETLYRLSDEYGLAGVLDMQAAVGDFDTAELDDFFADTIHESQLAHRRIERLLRPIITP